MHSVPASDSKRFDGVKAFGAEGAGGAQEREGAAVRVLDWFVADWLGVDDVHVALEGEFADLEVQLGWEFHERAVQLRLFPHHRGVNVVGHETGRVLVELRLRAL